MERLPDLGRGIPTQVGPTYQIYGELLRQPNSSSAIHQTSRQEFSYGPDVRQKLDLYSPGQVASHTNLEGPRRVLIFVYGGGFISGDKRLSGIPGDVAYTNLGHFFAESFGFETIVMDYRLIGQGGVYPSGADDLDLVLQWVEKEFGGRANIYILANSAGAVHTTSWLFGEKHAERRNKLVGGTQGPKLQAIGLLGCPFRLDPAGGMKPMLSAYFGSAEQIREAEPTALLLRAVYGLTAEEVARWPRIQTMVSELDPENDIIETGREFAALWQEKGGRGEFVEIKGHNHISPPLALGSGIPAEEAWGHSFGKWLLETQ